VIRNIALHGTAGSVLWNGRKVGEVTTWAIARPHLTPEAANNPAARPWTLTATLRVVDAFQLRQRPLYFVAPRARGFWCWPVGAVRVDLPRTLVAELGQPEQ
jgi:hypothetical protein